MNSMLLHGCFDSETLLTLNKLGVKDFAFDLRARSPNLITFKELNNILSQFTHEQIFLTFGEDKKETIHSFLNLLKDRHNIFTLIMRDKKQAAFYSELNHPFYWMFEPDAAWKEILSLTNARGVLLPLKYQGIYHKIPELWSLIENRNLDAYLHAETFEETVFINLSEGIKLSLDLSHEVEKSFRRIDQDKLKCMKIWGRINENPSL